LYLASGYVYGSLRRPSRRSPEKSIATLLRYGNPTISMFENASV